MYTAESLMDTAESFMDKAVCLMYNTKSLTIFFADVTKDTQKWGLIGLISQEKVKT